MPRGRADSMAPLCRLRAEAQGGVGAGPAAQPPPMGRRPSKQPLGQPAPAAAAPQQVPIPVIESVCMHIIQLYLRSSHGRWTSTTGMGAVLRTRRCAPVKALIARS